MSHIKLFAATLLSFLPTLAPAAPPPNLADAKWIWPKANATGTFYFRKSFTLPDALPQSARLYVCCDNTATLYINGHPLGKAEPLLNLYSFDLTPHLRTGQNTLALACTNPEGPGALLAKIFLSPNPQSFPTDSTWKLAPEKPDSETWISPDFDDSAWTPSPEIAPNGSAPWPSLRGYTLTVPPSFPQFKIPSQDTLTESLRHLFYLHYAPAQPLIPLWDEWMPMATLWPAQPDDRLRHQWARALSSRPISPDGYVHTLQHDGTAHAQGWPFPLWQQGGGIGWHFAGTGVGGYEPPSPTKPDAWTLTNGGGGEVTGKGWQITLDKPAATAATAPFKVGARLSPYLRLNWWAAGLEGANPFVEWTTADHPDFSPVRRIYFSPAGPGGQSHTYMPMGGNAGKLDTKVGETRTMIPTHNHPEWKGTITQLRLNFDNPAPAQVVIKSLHTAFDTRHSVNNLNFIRGCADYFSWTADYAFLRSQMPRIRTAMRFVTTEFRTREKNCIYTTWPGHEGRSGIQYVNGQKRIIPGNGVGSNYWDLLPFGGEDALATVYYYDTLLKLASLEQAITDHPEWNVSTGADAYDPTDLRAHARSVKNYGTKRFWNPTTNRFGTVDLDGVMHDYGFTFLNNEAVHFDFANPDQAKQIRAWIDGARIVEDDTSTGKDIYHYRFGPRSTTKRNIEYYFWGWSNPESIPFGYQVQDGGAVLGWSYHDLSAILKVNGPDAAATRLATILQWFTDTQEAGGYRAYYSDPSRGTMQGANVAGGLGLDNEFFESVLPPQILLYGFLGLQPTPTSLSLNPRLPKSWPSLTVTNIRYHHHTLSVTATHTAISLTSSHPLNTIKLVPPDPSWAVTINGNSAAIAKK
jgi:hypothetical protein